MGWSRFHRRRAAAAAESSVPAPPAELRGEGPVLERLAALVTEPVLDVGLHVAMVARRLRLHLHRLVAEPLVVVTIHQPEQQLARALEPRLRTPEDISKD